MEVEQPPAWRLHFIRRLEELRWEEEMEGLAVFMEKLTEEMKNVDKNVAISTITGSTAAILGGIAFMGAAVMSVVAGVCVSTGVVAAPAVAAGFVRFYGPLSFGGFAMVAAGSLTSSGSKLTKHLILLQRAKEAKKMLQSRAHLFKNMKEKLESFINDLDRLCRRETESSKGTVGRIKAVVQDIITMVVDVIRQISAALIVVLVAEREATAATQAGKTSAVTPAITAAAVDEVFANTGILIPVHDVISATHILRNGGKSEESFQSIARTVRAIQKVMQEEFGTVDGDES